MNDRGILVFDTVHCDISQEKPAIDAILKADFKDLPEVFPYLTELNREIATYKGKPLTVGKALLLDTKWNGRLPFDDAHVSFQRFLNYTDAATRDLQQGASR